MNETTNITAQREVKGLKELIGFIISELKPTGKIWTPFNIISGAIILLGAVLIVYRFAKGLGAVTNLSNEYPWGLWIGFDVVTGVAFAGGAYTLCCMVYIFGVKQFYPIIRATVLSGFLAYVFYAGALALDVGRPWNMINPIFGKFGVSSVLFLVAWHFMLYMMAEFVEFSPAVAEWLGWKNVRKFLNGLTLGAVIFGITLSMLHQSGLGALYLLAKGKIHPLWYSEFIPLLFFVSSIFAGVSIVIFEGTISHRVFKDLIDHKYHASYENILCSLGRIAFGAMFVYLFLQILVFIHGKNWIYLSSPMGYWYLLEICGFVLIPFLIYLAGVQKKNITLIRIASIMTIIGIIINRLNVSIIAFKWDAPVRYFPSWMEIEITLAVISAEIWAFRWIVSRMPVLNERPGFKWIH